MRKIPPQNAALALRDAVASHQQGQVEIAEKIYAGVLKGSPNNFDALHLLGLLKLQTGRIGEAHRLLTSALREKPDSADALTNLGFVLGALKRLNDALASFDKALAISPDHLEALGNRGNVLLDLGRPADALACFDQVLVRKPDDLTTRVNRGNALLALGEVDAAIAAYDTALAQNAESQRPRLARAHALMRAGRYADSLADFDRLLTLAPREPEVLSGRGLALQALDRYDDAFAAYAKALLVNKDYAEANYGEALALLATGDYRMGFEQYEWRWKRAGAMRRNFGKPLWLGEYPLGRRIVLLHADGDIGETIQFARYAPLLARAGAKVILEVQPELTDLLSGLEGVSVIARGDALPAFDVHCPLGSLPLACKTEFAGVPAVLSLRADDGRIAKWRPRLEALPGKRIAVAWESHANDRRHPVAIGRLRPLLEMPGVGLIGMQRGLRGEHAAEPANIVHLGTELEDLSDAAAVVALADLVLTTDNKIAHLAAAMGRPVWVLLPSWPDWRWTHQGDTSPWYPDARLFRQTSGGDWDSVIARVAQEIAVKFAP